MVDPRAARRRRRDGMRGDARRTAEYLASRGKTPVEALHDIVMMGWRRAVIVLAAELRVSPERAFELFLQCANTLLPYTAPKHETLELGPGAAGGLALGHFLAARAMGDMLAAERAPGLSRNSTGIDRSPGAELPLTINGLSAGDFGRPDPGRTLGQALPPKGAD
jgi:hypothetical protein